MSNNSMTDLSRPVRNTSRHHTASVTRVVSPWANDDPVTVNNWKKRAKSANNNIVLISGAKSHKPTLQRSHTLLSFMPEPEPLPKLSSIRRSNTFMTAPRRSGVGLHVKGAAPGISPEASSSSLSQSSLKGQPISTNNNVTKSRHQFSDGSSPTWENPIPVKRNVRVCKQGWARDSTDDVKPRDNHYHGHSISNHRLYGAKRASPAGVIKTVTHAWSTEHRTGTRRFPLINSM